MLSLVCCLHEAVRFLYTHTSVDDARTAADSHTSLVPVCVHAQDAVSLARALEFNDTLATLNFTHNPIGEVRTLYIC